MNKEQDWYEKINKHITMLENQSGFLDRKKWHFPLLSRLAKRVDSYSDECQECHRLKYEIEVLCGYHANSQQTTPSNYQSYQTTIKSIVQHLKRKHRLVNEKQNIKRLVSASFLFGLFFIMLGYLLFNFGITLLALSITIPALFIRVIFSCTVGYLLDLRAKRRGLVI
ncbi:MAG TPA: magnesium transporter [Dehalococcoidia bacterium]|nr:magnesium transporter [Dehalococcoidia bacterium]